MPFPVDTQEVPVISANGHDAEGVLQVSLFHQCTRAEGVEDGDGRVYGAVVQGVLLRVDVIIDTGARWGRQIVDGVPTAVLLWNDA